MDDESSEAYRPKISTVEVILIGCVFVLFDALGILFLLFGLDDFGILDILSLPIFFYLYLKGVPPMRQAIANLLEAVPYLGALPMYTIGWGFTVALDRNPKSFLAKTVTTAVATRAAANRMVGPSGAAELKRPPARGLGYKQFESAERTDKALASRSPRYARYVSTPEQKPALEGAGGGRAPSAKPGEGRTLGQMTGADRGNVLETAQQRMFSPEGSLAMGQEQGEEGPVFLDGNTVNLGDEEAA